MAESSASSMMNRLRPLWKTRVGLPALHKE